MAAAVWLAVQPAVGWFDDFAEVVGVKKPGGKVRAADLRGRVVYRLPLLGVRLRR